MKAHQAEHSISLMARVLGVSRSGYYAWLLREPSLRAQADQLLLEKMRATHLDSRGTYGVRRIHAALRNDGWRVGKKRVSRLMKEAGIAGIWRRRYRATTQRDPKARPSPDLVNREFKATGPNQLWVADITHIPTKTRPVYLATVLDVWSRRVVGWALDTHMESELVERALLAALDGREARAVIHHSDQGSQYTSKAFRALAKRHGVRVSMGSVGDCYDNAMAESLFATLECELLDLHDFDDPEQAIPAVFAFIAGFYNNTRLHSSIGYRTPNDFERLEALALAAK